jgi:hypothetical protein
LQHAFGKCTQFLILTSGKPDHFQHFLDALFKHIAFHAIEPTMKFKEVSCLEPAMEGGELRQIANLPACLNMIDWLSQHAHFSFCGRDQPGEYLHHCALTGAVWSKKAESLAPIGDKANIFYCDDLPVYLT